MQTLFDAPMGNDPVALNLSSMGKGEAWVNGQALVAIGVLTMTTKAIHHK